ncbi:fimbrial chaperone protein [Vibrio sp. VGrn 2]|nr:fimbrial chaperone protein [Vibrio sp. VGrn 2]
MLSMKFNVINVKNSALVSLMAIFVSFSSSAAFVLNGTRVIYQEAANGATVVVNNQAKSDYAGQAWVDSFEEGDNTTSFVSIPSFFEVKAETKQVLRMVKVNNDLPSDRESIFWLNVQEIPKADTSAANKIVIAINTKVKMIYRPEALATSRRDAEANLYFYLDESDGKVKLKNPTPYYFSIKALQPEIDLNLVSGTLAPFSTVDMPQFKSLPKSIKISAVDDYGAVNEYTLKPKD